MVASFTLHMRRTSFFILILLALAAPRLNAQAQPPASSALPPDGLPPGERLRLVAAARCDAIATLRNDLMDRPVANDQTLADVVRRLNAGDLVDAAFGSAGQRGAPRFRDDTTCELRIELSGVAIADALKAAADRLDETNALTDRLADALTQMRQETYTVVGVSTTLAALDRIRPDAKHPDAAPAWRAVADTSRMRALESAYGSAVALAMDRLRAVRLPDGKVVGDALSDPSTLDRCRKLVGTAPVSRVEFGDDLQVRVMVASGAEELWPEVRGAIEKSGLGPRPDDEAAWKRLESAVTDAVGPASGRGFAEMMPAVPTTRPAMPTAPPEWAGRMLEAEGTSQEPGLRGARMAEAVALERLRKDLQALKLADGRTVESAARDDRRIADAVNRSVNQAQVEKATYQTKQTAVRVSLTLDSFWRELTSAE